MLYQLYLVNLKITQTTLIFKFIYLFNYLKAYVKNRYVEVPHSQLTRAATDKCVQTRRNFRKKIKAAQSYFGMFPAM